MKGKVTSIVLLFLMVVPLTTSYFFVQLQKMQVKKEVKWKMIAGLDKEELVLFKFTEAESQSKLKWEHAKEFEYQGEMYDVVEIEIRANTIYYWCWWDHKETKLNRQLEELVTQVLDQDTTIQGNQRKLVDYFKKLFNKPYQKQFAVLLKSRPTDLMYSENLAQMYSTPPVPPPR